MAEVLKFGLESGYLSDYREKSRFFTKNGKFTICGLLKLIKGWSGGFANKNRKLSYHKLEFCHNAPVLFREFAILKFANLNKTTINNCLHLIYWAENQINGYV